MRTRLREVLVSATIVVGVIVVVPLVRNNAQSGKTSRPLVLSSGKAVQSLWRPDTNTLLLVLDPADCLTCDPGLDALLKLRGRHPSGVRVLLSRAPLEREMRALTIARLVVADTLRDAFDRTTHPWVIFIDRRGGMRTWNRNDRITFAAIDSLLTEQ
jgi:hypothetical protein